MGTSIFNGGTTTHHSISDNVKGLREKYKYSNGYFGDKGQGRDFTRNIASENPVKTADGTSVVEINIRQSAANGGVKYQKIHFVKGD